MFVLLVLFATFFSAILLAVTSFARSFKEAQAYLIPLMLFASGTGHDESHAGIEIQSACFSVLPLVNIVLLARDLMEGHVDPTLATVAVCRPPCMPAAAIAVAARIFGTDAILYGSQATWSDLLRPRKVPRSAPSVSGAMLSLAIIFPLYFLLANSLQRLESMSVSARLLLSGGVTVFLFTLLPLIAARLQRVGFRDAFLIRSGGALSCLAAIWLGLSLWPLAHELFLLNRVIGLNTLSGPQIEAAQKLLDAFRQISPALVLATLAIIPAFCEELFFRGYLFAAMRARFSAAGTIFITALLFGAFHVVVTSGLSVERLLPSTFSGLVLGWVCLRTNSVLPGIFLHASHNGLLLLMGIYHTRLLPSSWHVSDQEHLPRSWVVASAISALLAAALIFAITRRKRLATADAANEVSD